MSAHTLTSLVKKNYYLLLRYSFLDTAFTPNFDYQQLGEYRFLWCALVKLREAVRLTHAICLLGSTNMRINLFFACKKSQSPVPTRWDANHLGRAVGSLVRPSVSRLARVFAPNGLFPNLALPWWLAVKPHSLSHCLSAACGTFLPYHKTIQMIHEPTGTNSSAW